MAVYTIETDDGYTIELEGPDNVSEQEVLQQAEKLYRSQQISKPATKEEPSTLRQLGYGFASARTDLGNLGDILESYMPLGTFFNPTETYGEEFMQMNPEQRRKFLYDRRQKMIETEYADVIAANEQDSLSAGIGKFAGSLMSPTTLIPVGHGYKAVAATSALLGAEYDALDQFMKKGEVDWQQTGEMAAISGALGTGAIYGGRKIKDVYKNLRAKKANAKLTDIKAAEERADFINDLAYRAREKGVADADIPKYIQDHSGLNGEQVAEAFIVSDVRPFIPTISEVKLAKDIGRNGLDTVNRINKGWLTDFWKPIADRIEEISPAIASRLRNVDMTAHVVANERGERAKPFLRALKKLNRKDRKLVKKYLLNGDFDDVSKVLSKVDGGVESFSEVTKLLDEIHEDLVSAGYTDLTKLPNYFPRNVRKYDELLATFDKEQQGIFAEALSRRAKQLGVKVLSEVEKEKILNEVARGSKSLVNLGLGATQKRIIKRLSDEQLEFYDDPVRGLLDYIRYASNNAAKRRFFGKGTASANQEVLNVKDSVTNLIAKELPELSKTAQDDLQAMLEARFTTGEQSSSGLIQSFRAFTYLTKLTNLYSALTQVTDLSNSVWMNGLGNTISAIFGKNASKVSMQKFGLDNVLAEEFINDKVLAKTLHKAFTLSGFRTMDKFGKNVFLRANLNRLQKLAASPKGIQQLRRKHGKEFGDEFTDMVTDLQNGNISENVKLLLWNELSRVQPISLSEMPLKYLQSPNGRIAYALKTFALKQMSNVLRRTRGEWQKGNKKEAIRNGLSWLVTVPTTGVGVDNLKDYIRYQGQDMPDDPESFSDFALEHADNILRLFGSSEYMVSKAAEGKFDAALGGASFFAPGLSSLSNIAQPLLEAATSGEIDPKIVKELPIVGQVYYYWLGGGIEADYDKAMKKEIKKRSER